MKRLIAYMVAFALSVGGLLTLTTSSADAATEEIMTEQCQRVQLSKEDWTVSHFYVKNSLYRKHMTFKSFLEKTRALSGFESDARFRRMPVGMYFCIPAPPVPTHLVLKDPAGDSAKVFVKLDGVRKLLHTSLPKEDLYDIDQKVVDAYYTVKVGPGVGYWYQTNSMYREAMPEDKFNQRVAALNSFKSAEDIRNLKPTDTVKLPARPPYVYAEGKPEALLTVVDAEKKVYVLPEKLPVKVAVAEPALPRAPTEEERILVQRVKQLEVEDTRKGKQIVLLQDDIVQLQDDLAAEKSLRKDTDVAVRKLHERISELEKQKSVTPPPTSLDLEGPDNMLRDGADEVIESASGDIERGKSWLWSMVDGVDDFLRRHIAVGLNLAQIIALFIFCLILGIVVYLGTRPSKPIVSTGGIIDAEIVRERWWRRFFLGPLFAAAMYLPRKARVRWRNRRWFRRKSSYFADV